MIPNKFNREQKQLQLAKLIDQITKNFPKELLAVEQWTSWEDEERFMHIEVYDSSSLTSLQEVSLQGLNPRRGGIAFVLPEPYVVVNFLRCVDEYGIDANIEQLIQALNSYAEYNHSGTDIRVYLKGSLPTPGCEKAHCGFDLIASNTPVSVTGIHVLGTPHTVATNQAALTQFYAELNPPIYPRNTPNTPAVAKAMAGYEPLNRMLDSKSDVEVHWIWQALQEKRISPWLCDSISHCVYSHKPNMDPVSIDQSFRASSLMRPCWDAPYLADGTTLGSVIIQQAIRIVRVGYL